MNYKLIFPRPVLEWFCVELLPVMHQMSASRLEIYEKTDVEYLNNGIVKYLLFEVSEKMLTARNKEIRVSRMITFNHVQVLTLFRFLHNYPIAPGENWKEVQKKYILRQITDYIPDLQEFLH